MLYMTDTFFFVCVSELEYQKLSSKTVNLNQTVYDTMLCSLLMLLALNGKESYDILYCFK